MSARDVSGRTDMPRVSAVVPAKNERAALPRVVADLRAQTVPPIEIIVADASSTDGTAELARSLGCVVVPGGLPAEGRNAGASRAQGDWLLFVDADMGLAPNALEMALDACARRRLDGVSTWFAPDHGGALLRLSLWLSNWYFLLSSKVGWAHSIGGFILVRRDMHRALEGFDTSIQVAEDVEYTLRISRRGRYAFLRRPVVEFAVRRFDKEGTWSMNFKWIGIELHRIFLGEIRKDTFRYFKPGERDPNA
jgi:glycosyltransferase involved in cell wall biosynthesis